MTTPPPAWIPQHSMDHNHYHYHQQQQSSYVYENAVRQSLRSALWNGGQGYYLPSQYTVARISSRSFYMNGSNIIPAPTVLLSTPTGKSDALYLSPQPQTTATSPSPSPRPPLLLQNLKRPQDTPATMSTIFKRTQHSLTDEWISIGHELMETGPSGGHSKNFEQLQIDIVFHVHVDSRKRYQCDHRIQFLELDIEDCRTHPMLNEKRNNRRDQNNCDIAARHIRLISNSAVYGEDALTLTANSDAYKPPNRYIIAEVTMDPRKSLDKLLQLERDLLFLLERQRYWQELECDHGSKITLNASSTDEDDDDDNVKIYDEDSTNSTDGRIRQSNDGRSISNKHHRRKRRQQGREERVRIRKLSVLDIVEMAGLVSRSIPTGRRHRIRTNSGGDLFANDNSAVSFDMAVKQNLIEYQNAFPLCMELMLAGRLMVMIDDTDVGTFLSDQISEIASTVSDLSEQLQNDEETVRGLQLEEARLKRDAAEKLFQASQRQLQLVELDKWIKDVQVLRDKIAYWKSRDDRQEVDRLTSQLDKLME